MSFARALTESFHMSVRTNCATEAPVVHTRVEEGGRGGGREWATFLMLGKRLVMFVTHLMASLQRFPTFDQNSVLGANPRTHHDRGGGG